MEHIKEKLKNGIIVNFFPLEDVRTMSIGLYIKGAGSSRDPKSKMGMYELLSGLILRGSKKFPTYRDINFEIESLGGAVSISSSDEYFAYAMSVPSREIKKALEVLLDLYLNPLLKEKDFQKEKVNQETSIRAKTNDPVSFAQSKFMGNIYRGNSIGNDSLGTLKTLSNIELSDMVITHKMIIKQKPTVVVMGSFDKKEVLFQLNETVGQLKLSKTEWDFPKFEKVNQNDKLQLLDRELDQTHLFYGTLLPGRGSGHYETIMVSTAILGAGFGSLAHQKIRDEMKLAYSANARLDNTFNVSAFFIYAGINKEKLEAVIEESNKLFVDVANGKFKKRDLERAKNYLIGSQMVRAESVGNKTALQASYLLYEAKPITFAELRENIFAVTVDDIREVFSKVDLKERYLTIIGANKANKANLTELIKA